MFISLPVSSERISLAEIGPFTARLAVLRHTLSTTVCVQIPLCAAKAQVLGWTFGWKGTARNKALGRRLLATGASGGPEPTWGQRVASAASHMRVDIVFALLDAFVVVAAYTVGLGLRMLDPLVGEPAEFWGDLAVVMPIIVLIHLTANALLNAYGHVWEHASTTEAASVVLSNGVAVWVLVILNWWSRATGFILIPWSVLVVGGLLTLFGMGMVRFRSRLFSFHRGTGATVMLIVGTSRDAVAFARSVPTFDENREVAGFLTDDETQLNRGRRLAGHRVLGEVHEIAEICDLYEVDEVLVIGGDSRMTRRVVDLCIDVEVRLRMLPSAEDILRDGVAAVDVRDIEVVDLLEREQVETDLSAVCDLIAGKRVLVTGAGGSIGSEIVRQVLQFGPEGVWALDRDETLLHEARPRWEGPTGVQLADVRDATRVIRLFEEVRPHIVFHAAALKHVPVLEAHPEEAVLTNVIGTRNVIEAATRVGVEHFALISTDKAVAPTSVMGASKRAAELLMQVGTSRGDGCTYTAVRFGNVLGSRGSVVPTFVAQIKNGGPVTVTDAGMTRYFMTVDEAVQLVLQASALATGSEVFLLDMGDPVRIEDMARRLIRLAGLSPGKDIQIQYTGRRPGEKLNEVLALEPLNPTSHKKVFEVSLDHPRVHVLLDSLAEMEDAALRGDRNRLRALLAELTDGDLVRGDHAIVLADEMPAAVSWS